MLCMSLTWLAHLHMNKAKDYVVINEQKQIENAEIICEKKNI